MKQLISATCCNIIVTLFLFKHKLIILTKAKVWSYIWCTYGVMYLFSFCCKVSSKVECLSKSTMLGTVHMHATLATFNVEIMLFIF